MKNIYLIGFMGTGKSTVAKALAERLDAECVEMDQRIETEQGMAITEIFEKYGEEHFRDLETALLRSFAGEENLVVSCGGGSVLREENAALMKEMGEIVLLAARAETIYERVKDSTNRPVLNGHMSVGYIQELMNRRSARYETVADVCIATDAKSVDEICAEIIESISKKDERRS